MKCEAHPAVKVTPETARTSLAAVHRVCVRLGYHEGIDGHISLRVPNDDTQMLISPYPLHWSEVTASSLLAVDLSDPERSAERFGFDLAEPSSSSAGNPTAWYLHRALQVKHPWHRCFIHVHPPFATALSCRADCRLEPLHQHMVPLYNDIAYFDAYCGEILSHALGEEIADAMGAKSIVFLANHGVIAAGSTPARAFKRLYYLERACQFQILAQSGGAALRLLDAKLIEPASDRADLNDTTHSDLLFDAWLRILDREEPGYAE